MLDRCLQKKVHQEKCTSIHIDHHADFWLNNMQLIKEQEKIDIKNEQRLRGFVKRKLSKLNTNFIVLSMYRGIIGDAISVSRKNNSLFGKFKRGTYQTTKRYEFRDRKGNLRCFYLGGSSVTGIVGHYGLLTDRMTHHDVQKVFNENVRRRNVILDIDLDYFSYIDDDGQAWAMNERHLKTIFQSADFGYLFNYIDVVSIALEPSCCGGNEECISILEKLNSLVLQKFSFDIKEVIKKYKL